jgi:hypothetical protein
MLDWIVVVCVPLLPLVMSECQMIPTCAVFSMVVMALVTVATLTVAAIAEFAFQTENGSLSSVTRD